MCFCNKKFCDGYTVVGTVQNKSTAVTVLGTVLKITAVPVLGTFSKKYRGTGTVLGTVLSSGLSLYRYNLFLTRHYLC